MRQKYGQIKRRKMDKKLNNLGHQPNNRFEARILKAKASDTQGQSHAGGLRGQGLGQNSGLRG